MLFVVFVPWTDKLTARKQDGSNNELNTSATQTEQLHGQKYKRGAADVSVYSLAK